MNCKVTCVLVDKPDYVFECTYKEVKYILEHLDCYWRCKLINIDFLR